MQSKLFEKCRQSERHATLSSSHFAANQCGRPATGHLRQHVRAQQLQTWPTNETRRPARHIYSSEQQLPGNATHQSHLSGRGLHIGRHNLCARWRQLFRGPPSGHGLISHLGRNNHAARHQIHFAAPTRWSVRRHALVQGQTILPRHASSFRLHAYALPT